MFLKVCKWTVISSAKNYQNSLKGALLRRKKLRWPRLIWPMHPVDQSRPFVRLAVCHKPVPCEDKCSQYHADFTTR